MRSCAAASRSRVRRRSPPAAPRWSRRPPRGGPPECGAGGARPAGAATAGSKEKPLALPGVAPVAVAAAPPPPRKEPIVRKWWLWPSVAAVTSVALGVGLYYGLRTPSTSTADAVLDFQVR